MHLDFRRLCGWYGTADISPQAVFLPLKIFFRLPHIRNLDFSFSCGQFCFLVFIIYFILFTLWRYLSREHSRLHLHGKSTWCLRNNQVMKWGHFQGEARQFASRCICFIFFVLQSSQCQFYQNRASQKY